MLDVTMDAGVIALPEPVGSADILHSYVDTLLDWSSLLDEPWVSIHISTEASATLFADGLYPIRDRLTAFFNEHGIVEYDVNTVDRVVNKLLTLTPSFEANFGLTEVLAEPLRTEPDIIGLTKHVGLQSYLARCVVFIAILRKYCQQALAGHSLIVRSAPHPNVKVRAQIHEIDHEREDLLDLPLSPDYFEGDILVCDDFKGLVKCLDEMEILSNACDDSGVELAVRVALFKDDIEHRQGPNWSESRVPIIGNEFLKTCVECCRGPGPKLTSKILRAIVETMQNRSMADVHALRTGKGGDDPQRMRGNDKAQRRDIDDDFHLHYWECSDGSIELGSVVHHNDYSIPE